MTRFTLKSNLTTINLRAELHSALYPIPGSSSILQNKTARLARYFSKAARTNKLIYSQNITAHLARYFSKVARIFSGSSSPNRYQILAT